MKTLRGSSLTEVLVALVASSILIMILMNQYLGVKRHYQKYEAQLESSLETQLVVDLIRSTIRKAGFTPCMSIDNLRTYDTRNNMSSLSSLILPSPEHHDLQINHMSDEFALLQSQVSPTQLLLKNEAEFSKKHPILIADCTHAEVHSIHELQHDSQHWKMTLNHALVYTYNPPVYVGEWIEEHFSIQRGQLFYGLTHQDALTEAVRDFTVTLKSHHGKRLLHVTLNLEEDKTIQLDTMLRMDS